MAWNELHDEHEQALPVLSRTRLEIFGIGGLHQVFVCLLSRVESSKGGLSHPVYAPPLDLCCEELTFDFIERIV